MNECTGNGNGTFWGGLGDRIVCILTYGGNAVDCRINYTLAAVSLIACVSLQCRLQQRKQRKRRQLQQEPPPPPPHNTLPAEPSEAAAAAAAAAPSVPRTSRNDSDSLLLPRDDDSNNDNTDAQEQEEVSSIGAANITPTVPCALASLGFTVVFQIGLCLGLACSGISIVWCAMAGWMVRDRWTRREAMVAARERRDGSSTRCNAVFRPLGWLLWNGTASNENHYGYCGRLVVHLALLSDAAGIVYYAVTAEAITTVAHVCALVMGAALYALCVWVANNTPRRTDRD
jgi:hypothetical protein